ncbi:ShlB/FhaC/HecB family hemolysin secretion/activation protein [Phenylobacterium sp.]|uniref:ShlB/FhaC/HecB family hemolysin secretion/activation protein n=1 Tax=Phenylobacterium sp. TaxID=1871053 RepID=UPI002F3F2672
MLLLALAAAPSALRAQPAREALPDRTGPQAPPQPTPGFAQPAAGLAVPAPPAASIARPPGDEGAPIVEVRVTADRAGKPRPPRTWTPSSGAGLRLDHRRGELLDAAWVRRQFALNGLPGQGGVARALALVQLINRAYLAAGFVNSGLVVRAQPAPGVLDLGLVYGGLAPPAPGQPAISVEWVGGRARGLDAGYVTSRLPSTEAQPLSAIDLEHDFRLLAEDPALRTVNAELKPGARAGEASLVLNVYPQDRYDLYVTAANDRSPSVGADRLAVGGSVRNALAAGDLVTGEAGVTGGLFDATVSYAVPVLGPGTTASVRAAYDDAAVSDSRLKPLDISARERMAEAGLTQKLVDDPLLPSGQAGRWSSAQSLSVGAFVVWRTSTAYLFGQPFSFAPGAVDGHAEYTALRLTSDYVRRNVNQAFAASLTVTFGLDGTRADVPGVSGNPRPDFHTVLGQLNYARRLTAEGLEFRTRILGQWSDGVLYAGERISAGGEYTVRGYRENLLLADRGLIGSLELAQPVHLGERRRGAGGLDWGAFSVSAFVDGATVRNAKPPQPVPDIYSAGVSILWAPADSLSARLTFGQQLKAVDAPGSRELQDRGFQFRITARPLRWF